MIQSAMMAKSERIEMTWNPRLTNTPVPIMFATTMLVVVSPEIFLSVIRFAALVSRTFGPRKEKKEPKGRVGEWATWAGGRVGVCANGQRGENGWRANRGNANGRIEARSAGKNLASRLSPRGLGTRGKERQALKARQKWGC